jgi:hypothetical protein
VARLTVMKVALRSWVRIGRLVGLFSKSSGRVTPGAPQVGAELLSQVRHVQGNALLSEWEVIGLGVGELS